MIKIIQLIFFLLLFNIADAATITTVAKKFTESKIIAEITRQFLNNRGYRVRLLKSSGTNKIRKMSIAHKIDFYWEYTGTAFLVFYKQLFTTQTADEIYQKIKKLDVKNHLVWLNPSKLNNTYAFAIRHTLKPKIRNISNIVDMLQKKPNLLFGCNFEFCRVDGDMDALQIFYNFKLTSKNIKIMDLRDIYKRLKNDTLDIGLVFTSDSKLYKSNLIILKDDRNFFPDYRLTPVVHMKTLKKYPKLKRDLNLLSSVLNTKIMIALNAQVLIKGKNIRKIARLFLLKNKLI